MWSNSCRQQEEGEACPHPDPEAADQPWSAHLRKTAHPIYQCREGHSVCSFQLCLQDRQVPDVSPGRASQCEEQVRRENGQIRSWPGLLAEDAIMFALTSGAIAETASC